MCTVTQQNKLLITRHQYQQDTVSGTIPFPASISIEEETNIHVDNQFHNHPVVSSQTHIFQDGISAKGGAQIIFSIDLLCITNDCKHRQDQSPCISCRSTLSRLTSLFANTICLVSYFLTFSGLMDDCLTQSRMTPNHDLQMKDSSLFQIGSRCELKYFFQIGQSRKKLDPALHFWEFPQGEG